MRLPLKHQYVDRESGQLIDEKLYSDALIKIIYNQAREKTPEIFRWITGRHATQVLGFFNYDFAIGAKLSGNRNFMKKLGVNLDECLDDPKSLVTARQVFERKIKYWETRTLGDWPNRRGQADGVKQGDIPVISPADSRVLIGSLSEDGPDRPVFIKEKFFSLSELLDAKWMDTFNSGDFAIFRLTPDKYHYNHTPVSGKVIDYYEVGGTFHSCNPSAVVTIETPYSKNAHAVTIIDTDVPDGSGVGKVAMIEVVAMMIGGIIQCYSKERYDAPVLMRPGLWMEKGQPKSLYRPGSSTDILLFEQDRIQFCHDLIENLTKPGDSRFTSGFDKTLMETNVEVRSAIAIGRK